MGFLKQQNTISMVDLLGDFGNFMANDDLKTNGDKLGMMISTDLHIFHG